MINQTLVRTSNQFIKVTLLKLGFNPKQIGTKYLINLINLAYYSNLDCINVIKLCKEFANTQKNCNYKTVLSTIKYSISTANISKAKISFESIFNYPFDLDFFTTKTLIEELIALLENIE